MARLYDPKVYRNADMTTIMEKAREVVEDELRRSIVLDATAVEAIIPKFAGEEVILGRVVGRGGFCVVRECTSIRLKPTTPNSSTHVSAIVDGRGGGGGGECTSELENVVGQSQCAPSRKDSFESSDPGRRAAFSFSHSNVSSFASVTANGGGEGSIITREMMARSVWAKRKFGANKKYVVKMVEPEIFHSDRVTYLKGVIDLALETHYLTSLSHPHILQLRGVALSGPYQPGYFLVLDHLQDVLSKRLVAWMHRKRATEGLTGIMTGGRRNKKHLLTERILVSYDVASAMEYVHSRDIIFRDLKPDNVGFDLEGSVRLFDFGLAKELRYDERDEDGLYRMTGFTGGMRYMAPEVGLFKRYNQKADVYSWSMLMWYIMALEPPFGLFTLRMFQENVYKLGYRPVNRESWPQGICLLMNQCWNATIDARPNFSQIKEQLRKELVLIDPHTTSFIEE